MGEPTTFIRVQAREMRDLAEEYAAEIVLAFEGLISSVEINEAGHIIVAVKSDDPDMIDGVTAAIRFFPWCTGVSVTP